MKTLLKIFFLMAVISLVAGCNKNDELTADENLQLKRAQPHLVNVPFEANMLSKLTNLDLENTECLEEGYVCKVTLEVEGTAAHMGKVHTIFNFCALGPDDPNIPGEDAKYSGSTCVMVAANGDELFLSLEGGSVITGRTEDHPDYVVDYWKDKVNITGGTGRFEGASGELQMDDYDTNIDTYSHHHWTGIITMLKGKKN
jgi:hypothetical protein